MGDPIAVGSGGVPWHERLALSERALERGELKLVFIVGMARSGTTWLAHLLGQHPAVTNLGETHLYNGYLGQVEKALQHYAGRHGVGIDVACTEEEFLGGVRDLSLRTLLSSAPVGHWPRVVVEKTPAHLFHVAFIHRLFPEAYFINVMRDPRSIVASWQAAGRGWGASWARRGTIQLALAWNHAVELGEGLRALTDRSRTVQYEALHARPIAELDDLLAWLGIAVAPGTSAGYVEACAIDKMRAGPPSKSIPGRQSAEGRREFFRRGEAEGWRKDLSRGQIARVEFVTRRYMERFGYSPTQRARMFVPDVAVNKAIDLLFRGARKLARSVRV